MCATEEQYLKRGMEMMRAQLKYRAWKRDPDSKPLCELDEEERRTLALGKIVDDRVGSLTNYEPSIMTGTTS